MLYHVKGKICNEYGTFYYEYDTTSKDEELVMLTLEDKNDEILEALAMTYLTPDDNKPTTYHYDIMIAGEEYEIEFRWPYEDEWHFNEGGFNSENEAYARVLEQIALDDEPIYYRVVKVGEA